MSQFNNPKWGLSNEQFQTMAYKLAEYIYDNHLGQQNGTTHQVLAPALSLPDLGKAGRPGVPGSPLLTALIKEARIMGFAICTNGGGGRAIYYATDASQVAEAANAIAALAQLYLDDSHTLRGTASGAGQRPERLIFV